MQQWDVLGNLVKTPICPNADQPQPKEGALAAAGGSRQTGNRLLTRAAPILVPKSSAAFGKDFTIQVPYVTLHDAASDHPTMKTVLEVSMHASNVYRHLKSFAMLLLLVAPTLLAGDANWSVDFENGNLDDWYLPDAQVWRIKNESGNHVLHLSEGGLMGKAPRRPVRFALFKPACVGSFDLRLRLRKDPKQGESDLLIAFGYQDRLHFYYAHLSNDDENPEAHNGLFKVDNADRRRIAGLGAKPALSDAEWHAVRIERNTESGSIKVFMDKQSAPIFQVKDKSITHGLIGFGSFNDTGVFDDIVLTGTPSDQCKGPINTLDPPDTSP